MAACTIQKYRKKKKELALASYFSEVNFTDFDRHERTWRPSLVQLLLLLSYKLSRRESSATLGVSLYPVLAPCKGPSIRSRDFPGSSILLLRLVVAVAVPLGNEISKIETYIWDT